MKIYIIYTSLRIIYILKINLKLKNGACKNLYKGRKRIMEKNRSSYIKDASTF